MHASRTWDAGGAADGRVLRVFRRYLTPLQLARDPACQLDSTEHPDRFVFGAVIAITELVDCHPAATDGCCAPWGDPPVVAWSGMRGVWHWVLRGTRALPDPVPAVGRQRLWEVDLGPVGVLLDAAEVVTRDPGVLLAPGPTRTAMAPDGPLSHRSFRYHRS